MRVRFCSLFNGSCRCVDMLYKIAVVLW
uniref:Uncharacterized protein n=1 Tax=Anguilla anguilla TaxID=7936 RepID=A0A0E9RVA1_ANGAN